MTLHEHLQSHEYFNIPHIELNNLSQDKCTIDHQNIF